MTQNTHNEKADSASGRKSRAKNNITRAYLRTYSDSGQKTAYVEWSDGSRTEGTVHGNGAGLHMRSLFSRAQREGIKIEHETW